MMNPNVPSRRTLLKSLGSGFGSLSLAGVLQQAGLLAAPIAGDSQSFGHTLAPRNGHFPAKARAIIQLFQNGGPSQMDLFDDKPELSKRNGQPHPEQVETFQLGNKNVLMGTAFKFARHGQSGMEFSELIPHLVVRRGRPVPGAVDVHGEQQPSVRDQHDADRQDVLGATRDGIVDRLRSG